MKDLTDRQKNILEIVIREHINSAMPISSKFIEEEYDLGVSPATIRGELFELIEKGYLYQPHTSAGRVPTDKGYRFFVDLLSEGEAKYLEKQLGKEIKKMRKEIEDKILFMRQFTRYLADTSSMLGVSYFPKQQLLIKEGWGDVLRGPEFADIDKIHEFMGLVNDFEENIDSLLDDDTPAIRVYIGSESPFSKRKDFSVLISPCKIMKKKGLLAIMGPKRMPYEKNIKLVESIIKILNEQNGRRKKD